MLKLSILNRLVFKRLPFNAKESIFEINNGGSNQFIPEDHIVIPTLNFKRRSSRKLALKLKLFMEVWVWFIKLVLVALTKDFSIAFEVKIWVRETTIVS